MDAGEVLESLSTLELAVIGNANSRVLRSENIHRINDESTSLVGNTSGKGTLPAYCKLA